MKRPSLQDVRKYRSVGESHKSISASPDPKVTSPLKSDDSNKLTVPWKKKRVRD